MSNFLTPNSSNLFRNKRSCFCICLYDAVESKLTVALAELFTSLVYKSKYVGVLDFSFKEQINAGLVCRIVNARIYTACAKSIGKNVSVPTFVRSSGVVRPGSLFGYVRAYWIQSFMSGVASCARSEPSINSTRE